MLFSNNFLRKYAKSKYSQFGEDGVIEELIKRLDISRNGWVCEFGAWDGKHFSNTFRLVEDCSYNAVYIEGDKNKYKKLEKTAKEYPNIIPINKYVDHNDTENSIDNILSKTEIPEDFDILSIDIDGYDYYVFKSMKKYRPKIIIIEIQGYIDPTDNDHIHEPPKYYKTGFRPMFNLGKEKGYTFALTTPNMVFIRDDLFSKSGISYENELENFPLYYIKRFLNNPEYVFSHYKRYNKKLPKFPKWLTKFYLRNDTSWEKWIKYKRRIEGKEKFDYNKIFDRPKLYVSNIIRGF